MYGKMQGNWEQQGIANPTISARKPFYAAVYAPNNQGQLQQLRKSIQIRRGGWGHYYWYQGGKKIMPVHMYNGVWVISK